LIIGYGICLVFIGTYWLLVISYYKKAYLLIKNRIVLPFYRYTVPPFNRSTAKPLYSYTGINITKIMIFVYRLPSSLTFYVLRLSAFTQPYKKKGAKRSVYGESARLEEILLRFAISGLILVWGYSVT